LTIYLHQKYKIDFKKLFLIILGILFSISFVFSIYLTALNQPWAYFDTRTRIWEFAAGGILMLFIFKVKIPKLISLIIGWIGLIGLISTGLVLEVEASFPGYVALWPVLSAILIMIAGQNPSDLGVEKLLGSKPMVKLGGLSYGLYLWHWPLLSFYYVIFDTQEVSILHGLMLIAVSLILSFVSTKLLEQPIGEFIFKRKYSFKSFTPIYSLLIVLVMTVLLWSGYNQYQTGLADQFTGDSDYPGALANTEEFEDVEKLEPIPNLSALQDDRAEPYNDGCHAGPDESDIVVCEYGETDNYNHTVALVGGSKSTHWLPSLQSFAEEESIRVLNVTKSGCRFSYLPADEDSEQSCSVWNRDVVEELDEENTDLVVTLADTNDSPEEIPEGYLNQFERVNEVDLQVMAIRDSPNFDEDVSECLSANGLDTDACDMDRDEVMPRVAAWDGLESPPSNVDHVDYTDFVCNEEACPAVVGNVIGYLDTNHMTETFNETLGPLVREDVMSLLIGGNDANNQNTAPDESSLIDLEIAETGQWVNYEGEYTQASDMIVTEYIPYSPDDEYMITEGTYISYYDGDEFIQTDLIQGDMPQEIASVEDADNIRLSFSQDFEDTMEVIEN